MKPDHAHAQHRPAIPMTLNEIDQLEMASFTLIMKQRIMELMSANLNTAKIKALMKIIRMSSPYFAEHYRDNAAFQLDLDRISRRTLLLMYEYLAFDHFPTMHSIQHPAVLPLANQQPHEPGLCELESPGMQKSESRDSNASSSSAPVVALPSKAVLDKSASAQAKEKEPATSAVSALANANTSTSVTNSREATPKPHYCEICDKTCHPGGGLAKHLRDTTRSHPHCELCKINFPSLDALHMHQRKEHESEQASPISAMNYCTVCKKVFKLDRGLQDHLKDLRYTQGHPRCEVCNLNFAAQDALEVHNQTSHQPESLSEPAASATVSLPPPQTPNLTPSSSQTSLPSTNPSPAVDPLFSLVQQAQESSKACPDDFARSLDEPCFDEVTSAAEENQPTSTEAVQPTPSQTSGSSAQPCLKGVTIAFSKEAGKHLGVNAFQLLAKRTGARLLLDVQFKRLAYATHYVHSSNYTSFADFQMAVNRDLWICHSDWLLDCANQQTHLDEKNYLLAAKCKPDTPAATRLEQMSPAISSPLSAKTSPFVPQMSTFDSGLQKPESVTNGSAKDALQQKSESHACPNCSDTFGTVDRYVDHLVLDGCLTRSRDSARQDKTIVRVSVLFQRRHADAGVRREQKLNPLLGSERSYIDQTLDTVAKIDDAVSLLRPLLLNLRYTSGDTPLQEVLTLFQTDAEKMLSTKEANGKTASRKPPQLRKPICSICLNPARQLHGLSCGHLGCKHCLTSCVTHHEKCPVCRTKQTLTDLRPVYWDV